MELCKNGCWDHVDDGNGGYKYIKYTHITATPDGQTGVEYDPPYCYFEGGTNYEQILKFNADGSNTGTCGRGGDKTAENYDRCVCRSCKYSEWSWETCTKTCGGGTLNGKRTIIEGQDCIGDLASSRDCNTEPCPG